MAMAHFNLVQVNKNSAPRCFKNILKGTGKTMGRRDNSRDSKVIEKKKFSLEVS